MISLVTGASGFVGSHVARTLAERGEKVRVLVRPQSSLLALEGVPVEKVYGDLRDPASLVPAVDGVDRVFHIAADYRLGAARPREIYDSNVTGTRNLLEAAGRVGVQRIVVTSSVATIAVDRGDTLPNESTDAGIEEMIGHYKRSKLLAEKEALKAANQGVPVVVVNPTTPVGPGDWKPTPTGQVIVDFLNGRIPAYVETGLNWVPVEDVALGHWMAAERGRVGERYILGGRNMMLKEVLDTLARISGRPSPRLRLPHSIAMAAGYADQVFSRMLNRQPRIPLEGVRMARHKMFVDSSKAAAELGFNAGPVEAALERAVAWYIQHGYVNNNRPAASFGRTALASRERE
ncbi:MAG TPA: hopanoid-associated sugar epimerase [Terriglobia bacterium]|nr:hopanoid-associated sugar epimerase [Terriglobia bacterium]